MKNNPLKPIILVAFLNIIYGLYQILILNVVKLSAIEAFIVSGIFIFLYFKVPKYAGAFMLYSTAAVFPIYFLTGALGLNTMPPSTGVYFVLGVIYVVSMFILWNVKKKYDAYLLERQEEI